MASKNVYFFKVQLSYQNKEINYSEIKSILGNIVKEYATEFDGYKSLDATPYDEEMHFMMDIYEYDNNFFFARISKQKPSNSMVQHDYRTYEKADVLPGNNENEKGIEQYTYSLLNYNQGILLVVSAMGAPNEKIINYALEKYAPGYEADFIPIPNARAIESIYEGEESEITKLEIEVPLPNLGTLGNVFHWKEQELLEILDAKNLSATIVLKPLRRESITKNPEETKSLMDAIREQLHGYTKAKMKAKARNLKLRDYNFFEDKFSYPIDIQNSYVQGGERIYYTVEQLVEIYKRKMREAYNVNEKLLKLIVCRE